MKMQFFCYQENKNSFMAGEVMIFVKTSPKSRKIKDGGWRAAFGEKVLIYRQML